MRVLYILPDITPECGGPAHGLRGYLAALALSGVSVDVATDMCTEAHRRWIRQGSPTSRVFAFKSYGMKNMRGSPSLMLWLWQHARSYDVVHAFGQFNGISSLAMSLCLARKVPVVLTPGGMLSRYTFEHRNRTLKKMFHRLIDGPNLRRLAAVQFESEREMEEATRLGLKLPSRSQVIGPPVGWEPSERAPAMRQRNVALFLSRIDPKKNLEALLAAWGHVRKAVPDALLLIAGSGPSVYVDTLRQMAPEGVQFLGFAHGAFKAELLARASVFVLPSHHENFGIAVVEAVANGLPVVVSREVQIASFVEENGVGITTATDAASLGKAIVGVLESVALPAHCRDVGPSLVASYFGLEPVGHKLASLYKTVLSARGSTAPSRVLVPVEG